MNPIVSILQVADPTIVPVNVAQITNHMKKILITMIGVWHLGVPDWSMISLVLVSKSANVFINLRT
jgi:hypothetical protein